MDVLDNPRHCLVAVSGSYETETYDAAIRLKL